MFFLDREGRYVYVNSKIEELTGYSAEEFYQEHSLGYTITHPEDHRVGERAFKRALLGKSTQHHEFRLVHRNGECWWTSAACYSVYGDDGTVHGIQVVIQDITDRKETQEALLRRYAIRDAEAAIRVRTAQMDEPSDLLTVIAEISGQLARLGVGHDSCSVQVCNADGTDFVSCSGRSEHLPSIEYLKTMRNLSWTPVSDHMRLYPWVREVWRTGKTRYVPATDEQANLPVGMSLVDVAFSHGTLVINKRQTHAYDEADIAVVERLAAQLSEGFKRFTDITQRRALENQLSESQKMEAVGQLTAGVSHNFNNMLMMIVGNIEMARFKGAAADDHLDAALEACDRAASVIKQLMLFSRHDDGGKELTDIGALAGQAADICRRTFDPRISIHLRADECLPLVMASAGQLQQVVMNMCLNARDAMEGVNGAPRLEIEIAHEVDCPVPAHLAEPADEHLSLLVRDNGSGMDEHTRAHAFEPFFTTKEIGRGTGIGLSTAYAIVRDHNGWIDVDSQPGKGTAFRIYLPVADAASTPSQKTSAPADGVGQTILVVDDEDNIRELVCTMLEGAGYKAVPSSDGEEALEVLERLDYQVSLILLDLSMPRVSGREVMDRIAAKGRQVKVVVFTGQDIRGSDTDEAVAVIHKPVQRESLLRTVATVISCSESA